MEWFRIARAIGQPLQHTMATTTSNEFLDWIEVLDKEEWKKANALHYYLAQLTQEVAKGHTKDPEKLKIEHFLLTFTQEETEPEPIVTEEMIKERTALSKAAWFGLTGVGPDGEKAVLGGRLAAPTAPGGVNRRKVR